MIDMDLHEAVVFLSPHHSHIAAYLIPCMPHHAFSPTLQRLLLLQYEDIAAPKPAAAAASSCVLALGSLLQAAASQAAVAES